jgi:four helix bundle protein
MATATSFEDLEVWKLSMSLTIDIYKYFKECKDWGFKDQIQRAAVSIPLNISEGFARRTNKEYCQLTAHRTPHTPHES